MLAEPAATAPPKYICFLCKRKFKSADLLTQHNLRSELHRWNLQKQDEELQKRKEELRGSVATHKKQLQDLVRGTKEAVLQLSEEDLAARRRTLERALRENGAEYVGVQEKLEAARMQRKSDAMQEHIKKSCALKMLFETRVSGLTISAGSASWQGNKDMQEDRVVIDMQLEAAGKQVSGFVVLDGHSGSLCCDAMVTELPRNLQKCLRERPTLSDDNLTKVVEEACDLSDREFLEKARKSEALDGSTCILGLIYQNDQGLYRLLIANIGDSRAVMCRHLDGQLFAVRLSEDQKPGREDERARIEGVGGLVDMQGVWRVFTPSPVSFGGRLLSWGLAVSRAFGDVLMKETHRYGCKTTGELVSAKPEIQVVELSPESDRFLILACDGIWDVLNDDEAVSVCMDHHSSDTAATALVRKAFEVGSDDNLSAIVVVWHPSEDQKLPESKKARS